MVYRTFFLGHNFVFFILKPKNLKRFGKTLFVFPALAAAYRSGVFSGLAVPVAYFVFIHRDGNMRRPRGRRIGLGLWLVTVTEYVTMYEKKYAYRLAILLRRQRSPGLSIDSKLRLVSL